MASKSFIVFLFICTISLAQKQINVDSLKQVLETTKIADSSKCNSYISLIKHYKKKNVDSCKIYFQKFATYADENNSDFAHYHYFKLKAGYYGLLIKSGEKTSDFINSNLLEALAFAEKIKDPKLTFEVYSRLTQENARLGNGDEALQYASKAENISIENGLWKETAYIYGQFGKIYNLVFDKTEQSLKYLLKSDSIYEQHNFQGYRRGFTLSFIGDVYKSFDELDKAISYQEQALSIFKLADNVYQQKFVLGKLALIESKKENYEKAINYALDALSYYRNNNYPMQEATFNVVLSDIYYNSGQIEQALKTGNRAIYLSRNNKHDAGLMVALVRQATLLRANTNFLESNELALEAENLALNMDGYEELVEIYEILHLNSENLGDYKHAYEYLKEYRRVNDSLIVSENMLKAKELEAKYQSEQQEQEIALLKSESELNKQKQKSERNILLAGLAITTIAGVSLFLLYRNRRKTNSKLRELDQLKSNFFTNISHEFRTPLTIISGIAQKREEGNSESIKKENQILSRNSNRLINLVNQLLDIAKLESKDFKIHVSNSDLSLFLKGLASSFDHFALSNNNSYNVAVDTMPSEWFDKDIIEKIVTNLLSNAFKYATDKGSVEFTAKKDLQTLIVTVSNEVHADFEIDDHKIFDRFYQIDNTHEGTGIGLALVKELVELYHGNIRVKKVDNMIQFEVSVSLNPDNFEVKLEDNQTVKSDNIITKAANEKKDLNLEIDCDGDLVFNDEFPVLLIVEDNDDMGSFLFNAFKKDYKVILKKDGLQGWEAAIEEIPDIIISDVMMPNMDGFTLCKKLKMDERTNHIPIVLLTAKAEDKDKYIGLETGADDYITKPFKINHLTKRLDNLLQTRKVLQNRYQQEIILKPTDVYITSFEEILINKIQDILDINITDSSFTVEKFASKLSMSRMQLHRKLKALTGLSATEFLRSQRLKLAVELLKDKSMPISQVGYEVGFSNPSYFSKCFKETYACSPSEFQNNY